MFVACGDDSGGDQTYSIAFVNDTDVQVSIGLCTVTDCATLVSDESVAPDGTYSVEATAGVPQWYVARDGADAVLGCFKLSFAESPTEGAGFLVSDAGPCP